MNQETSPMRWGWWASEYDNMYSNPRNGAKDQQCRWARKSWHRVTLGWGHADGSFTPNPFPCLWPPAPCHSKHLVWIKSLLTCQLSSWKPQAEFQTGLMSAPLWVFPRVDDAEQPWACLHLVRIIDCPMPRCFIQQMINYSCSPL